MCFFKAIRADVAWKAIVMRTLLSILLIAGSGYLLLLIVLYLFQSRMVYLSNFPERALIASPDDIGLQYENVSLTTSDNEQILGWYIPAENSNGVLLFFHGNAGNISHRLDSIGIFHELDLDVLIIDYRGYGESTGTASEQGTYRDAKAAWDYLVNIRGVPANRIIVFGRSLGGAIGAWLGARTTPAAVIIDSSFSSGVDMAKRLYPFLPAQLVTRLRYPVAEYASELTSPAMVVHSRQDEIIPFEMGQEIYSQINQPRKFLEISGDHNNGFLISRADYIAALRQFIRTSLST